MKSILILIFLTFTTLAFAQSKIGKISGQITDENQKGVDAATVTLVRAKDNALVKVAVTNKSGVFEFEKIAEGEFKISVTSAGFQKKNSESFKITAENPAVKIDPIRLAIAPKSLGEVTVTGKRPLIENKIDRTVVNVEAAPTNAGATAMEVLEKSPGISVDNDGNISLKGKQGVIVMMDGKPTYLSSADLATLLKNMPASALDQIEIMTNPPAKYDAAGNSGIINIKTKKSRAEGFNGSITVGSTLSLYESHGTMYTPYKSTNSFNMNYRKAKFNLFGNYNYNYREGKSELDLTRKFFDSDMNLTSISTGNTQFNQRNNNHTLKLGVDYFANKNNIFGVVLNGFGFFGRPQGTSDQRISYPDGSIKSRMESETTNELTFYNYSANFNYKHIFDSTGRELTTDVDYIGYSNTSKSTLVSDLFNAGGVKTGQLKLNGDIPGKINILSWKVDYTQPMKGSMRFDAGFKLSRVRNDNEVRYERDSAGVWIEDDRSNHFIYEEDINAAYVSINKKWKKFSAQTGLRLENTVSKGDEVTRDSVFKRDYTSLFPTVYLNYEAHKNHTFTLSYGRRIQRPNYQDLNPFLWFLDSLTYRKGNPYLLPQYAHNMELRHSYKNGITTTLNYTITEDVISQILNQVTTKEITYLTVDNVARLRNMGIGITAPFKPAKWWNVNLFLNVFNNHYTGTYYNSFTGVNDPIDLQYTSYMVNVTNTFSFKKGWSAELSGWYRAKGIDQLTISEPMYFMAFGGQKTIMKGNGTLRLNVRDPFHWQKFEGNTKYSEIDVKVRNRWDNRNITATFSYRFGKSTVPQARKRSSGATEEDSRTGQQQ